MWQDTWERSVRYENLPVGEYAFKVIAINRDLVESVAPATLKLTVVPDPRNLVISTMQTEIAHLRREVGSKYHFANIIGHSAVIKQTRVLMEKAIDSGARAHHRRDGGRQGVGCQSDLHQQSAQRPADA